MQIQVFSIPMEGDDEATERINRFLRTHKVLCIEKAHEPSEAGHKSSQRVLRVRP